MLFIIMDSSSHHNKKTGILIPRPQYPLYSAAIAQLDAAKVCESFIPGLLAGGGGGGGVYWYHGAYDDVRRLAAFPPPRPIISPVCNPGVQWCVYHAAKVCTYVCACTCCKGVLRKPSLAALISSPLFRKFLISSTLISSRRSPFVQKTSFMYVHPHMHIVDALVILDRELCVHDNRAFPSDANYYK